MKLDVIANCVFTQLELLSGIQAVVWGEQRISHGKPGGHQPPRSDAPWLAFRRRYERSHSDEQKRTIVHEALQELKSIRIGHRREDYRGTKAGMVTVGLDTRPASTVAEAYGYSVRHVYRCRAEARRESVRSGRVP